MDEEVAAAGVLPGMPQLRRLATEVRCLDCHRLLHDPESRLLRRGHTCRGAAERVTRYDVPQDPLPGV